MNTALDRGLSGRIFVPIVLANIAAWLVVLTLNILGEATIDIGNRANEVKQRSAILETCTTEAEVIMTAKVLAVLYEWSPEVPILFELWTNNELAPHQNRRLFFNQRQITFSYPPLIGNPQKITQVVANGNKYNLIRQDGRRWSLRIAIPKPMQPLHEYVMEYGTERNFLTSLGVSFFILILALWLAVSRGLMPLRTMARHVAQRPATDLLPLNVDARYAELKPLAAALDTLLLQLKGSIEREQLFIQHAAQQLQSPMEKISALVQVLASDSPAPHKALAEQQINEAIDHTSHLIQQLLEMAWVDGVGVQEKQTQDIAQLVRQYLVKIVPRARTKQITVSLETPEILPHCLERNSFQLIFHNLLDNAIRYGRVGGMIEIELKQEGDSLLLSVADDGPGIRMEERERVFERFYRGAGNDAFGSGLGLTIVRQAAKRMDATVDIAEGHHRRGCRFLVRIPGETPPST